MYAVRLYCVYLIVTGSFLGLFIAVLCPFLFLFILCVAVFFVCVSLCWFVVVFCLFVVCLCVCSNTQTNIFSYSENLLV